MFAKILPQINADKFKNVSFESIENNLETIDIMHNIYLKKIKYNIYKSAIIEDKNQELDEITSIYLKLDSFQSGQVFEVYIKN